MKINEDIFKNKSSNDLRDLKSLKSPCDFTHLHLTKPCDLPPQQDPLPTALALDSMSAGMNTAVK